MGRIMSRWWRVMTSEISGLVLDHLRTGDEVRMTSEGTILLCKAVGATESTIRNAIGELRAAGLVCITRGMLIECSEGGL